MASAAPEPSTPPKTVMSESAARNQLADVMFSLQDQLTEGAMLQLSNAAKAYFDAKRAQSNGSASLDIARNSLASHLEAVHVEVESYREQLLSATVTIDELRARRDQYAKRLAVAESVCVRLGGKRETLDTEYEMYGLLPHSEFERDRKRRRSARVARRAPMASSDEDDAGDSAGDSVGDSAEDPSPPTQAEMAEMLAAGGRPEVIDCESGEGSEDEEVLAISEVP